MTGRDGDGWIQTYLGSRFYPTDPRPTDVFVEDIAHALAYTCRFTGHCKRWYSVAQHSVLVSQHCDPADAFWGLLHDAAEAYLCDLARPAKRELRRLGITVFDDMEARIMAAVCERFAMPAACPPSVKAADEMMLVTEARDLMAPLCSGWRHTPENGYPTLKERIEPLTPTEAETLFLDRYRELET
jgi:5'-deoxynucleotidase YfbR-like HD superfamily hydrolase